MPHHSKQQSHQQHPAAEGYSPGCSPHRLRSQQSFPPTNGRSDKDYHHPRMSVPSSLSMPPGTLQANTQWAASTKVAGIAEGTDASYEHQSLYHNVPTSPADTAGSKNSAVGQCSEGEQKVLLLSETYERDLSRGGEIASVLLLAAAASSDREMALAAERKEVERQDAATSTKSNRPLKKRKNYVSILHNKSEDEQVPEPGDVCHVSPMSNSSKSTTAGVTLETRSPCNDTHSTPSGLSYELKGDGADKIVHENTKKGAACSASAQPQTHEMIPHFPSALHWLLTESLSTSASREFVVDHSVMQWVSHGQAWRIVRWDAFHRQVLPMLFPQLSVELDGRPVATGSIDAFMWQLAAWGFEEIKDGPDVGTFAHTLFRRGHPQLCREMRFSPKLEAKNPSSRIDTRSILRVPSLTSTSGTSDDRKHLTSEHEDGSSILPDARFRARSSASTVLDLSGSPILNNNAFLAPSGWSASPSSMRPAHGPPVFVNYRPEEMNLTPDGWKLGSTQGRWAAGHPATPQHQAGYRTQGMPPYSPIRIRSARGACRLAMNSNASLRGRSPPNVTPARGFPVSNRGMGRRNVATSVPSKSEISNSDLVMLSKPDVHATPTVDSVAKHAEAKVPRSVLKRKLPLMLANQPEQSSTGV